jgi:hypothetical protein
MKKNEPSEVNPKARKLFGLDGIQYPQSRQRRSTHAYALKHYQFQPKNIFIYYDA